MNTKFLLFCCVAMLLFSGCDEQQIEEAMQKADQFYAEKEYEKACEIYRECAKQGSADAQYAVGFCYDEGKGFQKDKKEAFYWWLKAAKQGHAKAQVIVAASYYLGEGVDKDEKEALKWLTKAKEQGEKKAEELLDNFKSDLFEQVKKLLK